MSLWAICEGNKHRKQIAVESWRVVEAQHISSSRDLVDSREEHDLLEELLEESKPKIAPDKHYLIFTPFRYPPLQYGSRFGRQYEPSLWYGSMDRQTAFSEAAYYRLKFFDDTSANLGFSEIPMTVFNAYLKSNNGIDLTDHPFTNHQDKISSKNSYEYSQVLGTDMRQSGIEVFIFASARTQSIGKNIATFTPNAFANKNNQYVSNIQNWQCLANKNNIEFNRLELLSRERLTFFKKDFESAT